MTDDTEDFCEDSPGYEAEDIGCNCSGIESEWQWDSRRGVYVCTGCGAIQ